MIVTEIFGAFVKTSRQKSCYQFEGGELRGTTVESIEIMSNGDMLLLLTAHRVGDTVDTKLPSLPPFQFLVAVDARAGRLKKWWPVSPASGSNSIAVFPVD